MNFVHKSITVCIESVKTRTVLADAHECHKRYLTWLHLTLDVSRYFSYISLASTASCFSYASVSVSISSVSLSKLAESIEMQFWEQTCGPKERCIRLGTYGCHLVNMIV